MNRADRYISVFACRYYGFSESFRWVPFVYSIVMLDTSSVLAHLDALLPPAAFSRECSRSLLISGTRPSGASSRSWALSWVPGAPGAWRCASWYIRRSIWGDCLFVVPANFPGKCRARRSIRRTKPSAVSRIVICRITRCSALPCMPPTFRYKARSRLTSSRAKSPKSRTRNRRVPRVPRVLRSVEMMMMTTSSVIVRIP